MKKILQIFLSSIILSTLTAVAQPVFTAADINPVVGDQYTYHSCTYANPGSGGANQVWDFSTLVSQGTSTNDVVTTASTPYGSYFIATSNVAVSLGGGNFYYYHTDASKWQQTGNSTNSNSLPFANFADVLHYPLTYNNSFTDSFRGIYTSPGPGHNNSGSNTVTVDGYGTVKTPAGTFANTLRVHFQGTTYDSAYTGVSWVVTTITTDSYLWYLKNNHAAIVSTVSITAFGNTQSQTGYLAGVVGVDELSAPSIAFAVNPNPAADEAVLDMQQAPGMATINIYSAAGMLVKQWSGMECMPGDSRYRLDVASLAEGVYFIQLVTDAQASATKKLVIAR